MRHPVMSRLALSGAALLCLQGCLAAEPGNMPADEAFALSASALSGSERYGLSGEVSVLDASGLVANRLSYEGEVTEHDNVTVQWKNVNAKSAQTGQTNSYEPLELLEAIKGKSASIAYRKAEVGGNADEVRFAIKLDGDVAKRRIADQLRKELTAIGEDKMLLGRKPEQSANVLKEAKATLENVLGGLKVTTECQWTANKRTWFPTRLQEDTLLEYEWKGKPYKEKRLSVTNFRAGSRNGTMD
ncbi:hypothetical protein [Cohnella sp. GCM10027633]|uniref:hypothetical protein n=1 Tax=unclassified Cohnella TaxID=2636738 RepID=UPI003631A616